MMVLLLLLSQGPPLAVEDAVARALERAPGLAARRAAVEAAEAEVGGARSAWWPRLGFDATYVYRDPKNELPIDFPDQPGFPSVGDIDDNHRLQVGLTLSQRLVDFGRGPRIEAGERRRDAEAAQVDTSRADLAFAVRSTFLAALLSSEVQTLSEASLAVARGELRRAERRREAGVASEVELAQARVRVASLEAQETEATSELARYRARLASLLGASAVGPLGGALETLAGSLPGGEIDAGHPELRRLDALARASEALADARTLDLAPTLSARGAVRLEYPRALELELGPTWEVGAVLGWTIFDGFARESEVAAQRARQASFARLGEASREELDRSLVDLRARARTADARLASARKTAGENELYLRVARAAVDAGTGTELDVLTAQLSLDRAKVDEKRALFEKALVRADILRVFGRVTAAQEGEIR